MSISTQTAFSDLKIGTQQERERRDAVQLDDAIAGLEDVKAGRVTSATSTLKAIRQARLTKHSDH